MEALKAVLRDFVEVVYVVTLPRLAYRQRRLRQVLGGVDYALFEGTDYKTLDVEALIAEGLYDPVRVRRYLNREMTLPEIAVALSHWKLYAHLLERGVFPVLIFEDDVAWSHAPMAAEALAAAFAELPADWELLYLGYESHEHFNFLARAEEFGNTILYHLGLRRLRHMAWGYYARPYSKHWLQAGAHDCTHAHVLTQTGCRRLYEMQQPVCIIADQLLQEAVVCNGMKAYALRDKLFINRSLAGHEVSTVQSIDGREQLVALDHP